MTIRTILEMLQTVEAAWVGILLLAAAVMLYRSGGGKRPPAGPEVQLEIVEALSVYLGGNPDLSRLCALAAVHPDEVRDTILHYQTIVAGREELCTLAVELGYVERWCQQAHSGKIEVRRKAFSCISAVAGYEPVRRLTGNLPVNALGDPDERIRLEAARILLSSGEPEKVAHVFRGVLSDTPGVRLAIAGELGRHAIQLCEHIVPEVLRSRTDSLNALRLLVSWERALPLTDLRALAEHPDTAVRVEVMRLLPFLPATPENQVALLHGLSDTDREVSAAAATAAGRLRSPDSPPSPVPGHWLEDGLVGQATS